jgi:tRNA-specific 2-thiouridylase
LAPEGGVTGRCCSLDDVYDARHVAQHLGIPYYVVNFESGFEEQVVKPFIDDYLSGRTPIPCTLCNNFIKFDQFLDLASGVGASRIATGHYARIGFDDASGRYQMSRGVDHSKDQTYFLFGLKQEQLARTDFPLGGYTKPQVRELARELGLPVAAKPDSQEICFVPNGDYAAFIDAYFRERGIAPEKTQGEIRDTEGRVLGEHAGVHHFTVGQRRGLRVAAGEPLYVIATEPASQRVIVGRNEDLLRATLTAKDMNWISIAPPIHAPFARRSRFATSTPPPMPPSRHWKRRRARRSPFRRAATRRHSRPGGGALRWRSRARWWLDRIANIFSPLVAGPRAARAGPFLRKPARSRHPPPAPHRDAQPGTGLPGKIAAERRAIADEVFRSIARLIWVFARFPQINAQNIHNWIRYEGLEHYLEAKKAGRGILFATAHFGNWELSAFAHALMTEPMHIMIRPLDNPGGPDGGRSPPAFGQSPHRQMGRRASGPARAASKRSGGGSNRSEHFVAGRRLCRLLWHSRVRQHRLCEDRGADRRGRHPWLRRMV